MPGLKQLKKFAQDIDALGNEANRRVEKSETLPIVDFPTNISEADDSEEFIFGLPEQSDSNASENIDTDSSSEIDTNIDSQDDVDVEALLASVAQEKSTSPVVDIPAENQDTLQPVDDFSLPGLDDGIDLSALEDFDLGSSIAPEDTLDNLNGLNSQSKKDDIFQPTDVLGDDLSGISAYDFTPENLEMDFTPENLETVDDIEEVSELSSVDLDGENPIDLGGVTDFSMPDFGGSSIDLGGAEDFSMPDFGGNDFDSTEMGIGDVGSSQDLGGENPIDLGSENDFSMPDFGGSSIDLGGAEDFSMPDFGGNDFDSTEMGIGDVGSSQDFGGENPIDLGSENDFSMPDFGGSSIDLGGAEDFSMPDFGGNDFGNTEMGIGDVGSSQDFGGENPIDLGSETDFSMPNIGDDEFAAPEFDSSSMPLDIENLSDVDFSGSGDDSFDNQGFENIDNPADDFDSFSDFDLVPPEVPQEVKKKHISFSSGKGKKEEVLSTELTEEQYKTFSENLNYYPLNLRLAIEEMIVGNEFNDDVVMEIIHKIIKKIPARQLATQVEKLMDRSIPVPMNYEKRTVAEYEAYRQSFEYNLKNKILPFTFASIIVVGFCILLGFLTAKFVVRPVKANILYKEGYTLIENGLYPQSESKFNEAVSYNSVKNWHFKYARAYVDNKQYERAGSMYERLLHGFKYDLDAGLEYATMELEERANYEKAEEITRRFVLDHHINSEEGLLLLGDIFLEWATNRDPEKFEDARIQYANLIQLYGQQPLYLSRMMRYFIRTDNLEEVLQLKEYFYPKLKKDILEPKDLVELSGYLLDKSYGELPAKDEYLRSAIEDVRELLEKAVEKAPDIPESMYNYGRYFVETGSNVNAQTVLEQALIKFENTPKKTQNRLIAEIDTYRLLGELSAENLDYLKAENYYVDGLTLFETERDNSNLRTDKKVGLLYSDLADLDYFISGNFDAALSNYMEAIENYNDTPSIRYRVGYIQYANENYTEALGSFIKAVNEKPSDKYLLLALGNTLTLRNSMSAAQGYYEKLIGMLDLERNQSGILRPQTNVVDGDLVELYMKSANNLGVVLSMRAEQTGNGNLLPKAMANYEESIRAFDALTRNQETMIRVSGSNLASFNQKYLTYTHQDFKPTIYTEISPILEGEKIPEKSVVD